MNGPLLPVVLRAELAAVNCADDGHQPKTERANLAEVNRGRGKACPCLFQRISSGTRIATRPPAREADGYAKKPAYRPLTKFENRGFKLGHGVWDLMFVKK
ncbi:hypothetical protein GCM10027320_33160 [Massilia solisilvae]